MSESQLTDEQKRENHRLAQQKYRAKLKENAEHEAALDESRKTLKIKREDRDREKADREKLEADAAAGDPLSRMKLAKMFSVEYWEAYRDYVNQFGDVLEVNEISTEDPEFPLKVALTVEELGVIRSSTKAHR